VVFHRTRRSRRLDFAHSHRCRSGLAAILFTYKISGGLPSERAAWSGRGIFGWDSRTSFASPRGGRNAPCVGAGALGGFPPRPFPSTARHPQGEMAGMAASLRRITRMA
jgi:hypothetical protein